MQSSMPSWTEAERLATLHAYGILDTPKEKDFDDVVQLVCQLLDVPIAAVNLIADTRQWFKAEVGLGVREMPLDDSICKFALLESRAMVVPDMRSDARFGCNPLVTNTNGLRFYAGELLTTSDGLPLGTLCALDVRPRPDGLTDQQAFALRTLARQVMSQIELRSVLQRQQALLADQLRAQEELRMERDRSERLLQGMDEGFVFLDRDLRIVQMNPGALKLQGMPEQDFIGMSHWDAWPGTEDLPLARHYLRALHEGVPVSFEHRHTFPDRRQRWMDVRAYPADGGLAVFFRDVTDRKDAEATLRATAQRLEFTLEAARIGDWDLDLVNDTCTCSQRHAQCFGYADASLEWTYTEFLRHVHPDDREQVAQRVKNAVSKLEDLGFECRIIWPDGTIHWIATHGSPYHTEDGGLKMSGIVYDISDRKQAELNLRDSERRALEVAHQAEMEKRRLDALLEAAPVGIIVANAAGTLVHFNAENRRLWGDYPESLVIRDYVAWKGWWADGSERHGQALAAEDWALTRALAGEAAPRQIVEIEPFGMPGTRRIILNSGAPIRDGGGRITGAVVAQMDITDRIKAEQALRTADRHKDEFLAMLAHELRNPLAPITSAADLLALSQDPGAVRKASAIIGRQARHMTGLIDDLLDVSRVTQGKITLDNEVLDLRDVAANAIEQVRPLIEKHKHRLAVRMPQAPARAFGDHKRLVQVVTNLLSNAAKYTPDGGAIELALGLDGDELSLSVQDNGVGMTSDLLENAFDLFSQANRSLDRSQGGLGIGLALVKSLLKLHGGSIRAASPGPNQGSGFEARLPCAWQEHDATAPPLEGNGETLRAPLRIAIVDDNEDAATMLALFLESLGHEVLSLHSSAKALAAIPAYAPDVCLLDIGLPEIDGFALAKRLRGHAQLQGVRLVAVTGYGQQKDRQEAHAAGFDELFLKPVDLSALQRLLNAPSCPGLHDQQTSRVVRPA
jgi:PAS domain S-box-containing protein